MTAVAVVGAAWLVISAVVGVAIGRAMAIADRRTPTRPQLRLVHSSPAARVGEEPRRRGPRFTA